MIRWMPLLALGCAPGTLDWRGEIEPLRSVLFTQQNVTDSPGVERLEILLSNSYLECDPVSLNENWEIAGAEFFTALTRENARHIYVELLRRTEESWVGRYSGSATTGYAALEDEESDGRMATGWFLSIEEATVTEEDGLISEYIPTWLAIARLDEQGWFQLDQLERGEDGTLSGQLSIPNGPLHGTIRSATRCDSTSAPFQTLAECDADSLESALLEAIEGTEELPDLLSLCGSGSEAS